MEFIDKSSIEFYNKLMDKDNITGRWFLTGTPVPVLSVLALYLWFVLSLGPRLMASRQPYQLKSIMRVYNVVQVMHNGYIVYSTLIHKKLIVLLFNNSCTLQEFGKYEKEKYIFLFFAWHYMVSKIIDLLDTVFMVLRKKKISFLHIYHHTAMVFFVWLGLSHMKTYQGTIIGIVNVYIHFIMYTYFFLATYPQLKPYLWWKIYLTKLQILQFIVALVYLGVLYYYECPISQAVTYIWIINTIAFLLLFINFYVRTYIFQPSPEHTTQNKNL